MSERAKKQVHVLRPTPGGSQSFVAKADGQRKPRDRKRGGFWDVLG
jgi:hypothetical protein